MFIDPIPLTILSIIVISIIIQSIVLVIKRESRTLDKLLWLAFILLVPVLGSFIYFGNVMILSKNKKNVA
jgi:hypothetical protein